MVGLGGFKERREALSSTLESHDGLTDGYRSEKEKKRSYFIIFSLSHREEEGEKRRRTEETRTAEKKTTKKKVCCIIIRVGHVKVHNNLYVIGGEIMIVGHFGVNWGQTSVILFVMNMCGQ